MAIIENDRLKKFEDQSIRTAWDEEKEEWYFSVQDAVAVLADSKDPKQYIKKMRTRDPVEAKHLKQQGVKAGVPDLCLPVPRGRYHGLYIEMKTEDGHTSSDQEWWGEKLSAQGYAWKVCHGWEAATAVLAWYLNLPAGGFNGC